VSGAAVATEAVAEAPPSAAPLTVVERAAMALRTITTDEKLRELVKGSADIKEITNADGYKQCHAARMTYKRMRIEIEKTGKEARDEAISFGKAVIAEEKRLVGIISVEEERLDAIQTAYDDRKEEERKAKVEAERQRVAELQRRIAGFAAIPARFVGRPAEEIRVALQELQATEVDETFADLRPIAVETHRVAVQQLQGLLTEREAFEAEQERQRHEQLRLQAARAQQELDAEAERQRLAAEREAQEVALATQRAEQDRLAREERERQEAEARKRREREEAEALARREAEDARRMLLSEIDGIRQQAMIAVVGRLGVRKGGTLECARDTLTETEAWVLDADYFGDLYQAALQAKATAIASIEAHIAQLEAAERLRAEEAEAQRLRDEQLARDRAALDQQRREQEERDKAQHAAAMKLQAEREALESARRPSAPEVAAEAPEVAPTAPEVALMPATEPLSDPLARYRTPPYPRPPDGELVMAVVLHFDVPSDVAAGWLGLRAQERAA
jgi:hypothetical protein